jgi:hypothetical protein
MSKLNIVWNDGKTPKKDVLLDNNYFIKYIKKNVSSKEVQGVLVEYKNVVFVVDYSDEKFILTGNYYECFGFPYNLNDCIILFVLKDEKYYEVKSRSFIGGNTEGFCFEYTEEQFLNQANNYKYINK